MPLRTAQEILNAIPGGPGYEARVELALEVAMNTEWWRGFYAPRDTVIATEIERLRQALYDICAAQPLWNGGIARHKPEYLYGFIEELRDIAREALK